MSRVGSTTSRSTWRERAAVFPFRADRAESEELPRAAHLSTGHGEGVEVSGLKTQGGFQDEKAAIRAVKS